MPGPRAERTLCERFTEDLASELGHGLALHLRPLAKGFAELVVGADGQCRTHVHSVLQADELPVEAVEGIFPLDPKDTKDVKDTKDEKARAAASFVLDVLGVPEVLDSAPQENSDLGPVSRCYAFRRRLWALKL
jgi:hypothetical protein